MQGLDAALFGLFNAGLSVPAWSIRFAVFASDILPTVLALAIALIAAFDRRWRHAFVTALIAVLAVWLIVHAMRSLVPIQRPAFYGLGIQWVAQGSRPGFPSLHAAGTFAAAFSLWCLPWRAPMVVALLLAAVVAWSRMYLGLHFPSDVIAAAMLGALVSIVVERGVSRPVSASIGWRPSAVRTRSRPGKA